jgi:PHP family Zn ribbon phosphoesterase
MKSIKAWCPMCETVADTDRPDHVCKRCSENIVFDDPMNAKTTCPTCGAILGDVKKDDPNKIPFQNEFDRYQSRWIQQINLNESFYNLVLFMKDNNLSRNKHWKELLAKYCNRMKTILRTQLQEMDDS